MTLDLDAIGHAYRQEHQVYESPGAARDTITALIAEVRRLQRENANMAETHELCRALRTDRDRLREAAVDFLDWYQRYGARTGGEVEEFYLLRDNLRAAALAHPDTEGGA